VKPLLLYLKTGSFENKTNMTFMKAYSVVVQFGDQQQHSYKLYSYYKKVISEYCEENVLLMTGITGEELLKKLAEFWDKQTILVFWMQRVFQYLDRFFTKSNNNVYPDLFSAALRSFQECVYDKVKDRCIAGMIDVINRERNGEDVDQDVLRLLVEMLCTVGDSSPKIIKHKDVCKDRLYWQSSSKGFYKTDFETAFLDATTNYYKAKVTGWMAECSCARFLEEVQRRLDDEERRINQYLDRASEAELKTTCQRELILNTAKQLVEMETGCKAMFQNQKYSELTLMYKLFRREPTMLPHVAIIKGLCQVLC
jgi:cullin 1